MQLNLLIRCNIVTPKKNYTTDNNLVSNFYFVLKSYSYKYKHYELFSNLVEPCVLSFFLVNYQFFFHFLLTLSNFTLDMNLDCVANVDLFYDPEI